jgi:hypothetical protein
MTSGRAMLWAYFDETVVNVADAGNGKQRPTEMFVGGCVATAFQWEKFHAEMAARPGSRWRVLLPREGFLCLQR